MRYLATIVLISAALATVAALAIAYAHDVDGALHLDAAPVTVEEGR